MLRALPPVSTAAEEALASLAGYLELAKTAHGVRKADFLRDHHSLGEEELERLEAVTEKQGWETCTYAAPTLKFWMKYPS